MAEAERWDQVYAHEPHLFTTEPNALLVEVAGAMSPGRALDIGMGQGRNAVWLAEHGWDVTGLDVSSEGVRQAQAYPGRLHAVHASAEDFAIGEGQWDLDDAHLEALNTLDGAVEAAVNEGNEETFRSGLVALLDAVRTQGTRLERWYGAGLLLIGVISLAVTA